MGLFSILFSRNDISPEIEIDEDFDDLDEMVPEEPADPDFALAGMRIGISYKDERGLRTKRVVRLKRLDAGDVVSYIHGYCELRKEDRTFRLDRIALLYDPATGEVLDSAEEFFGPYVDRSLEDEQFAYEKSKFRGAWRAIEALRDELIALILVARADGRFVKSEQSALLKYASVRASDLSFELNDEEQVVLLKWIKTQDPSEPEARVSLKNLLSTTGALESLWEVSEIIAEADGKVNDAERRTFAEVRRAIEAIVAEGSI